MLKFIFAQTSTGGNIQRKRLTVYVTGITAAMVILFTFLLKIFPLQSNQAPPAPEVETPMPERSTPNDVTPPTQKPAVPKAPSALPSPHPAFVQPVVIKMRDNTGNINFGTQETGVYNNYKKH